MYCCPETTATTMSKVHQHCTCHAQVVSTPSKKEPAFPPRTPRIFCDQPDLAPPPVRVLHSLLPCKKHTAGEPESVELMQLSCCWSQRNAGSRSIQVVTFIDDNSVLFFRAQSVFACDQRSHRIACNSRGAEKSGVITCGHCALKVVHRTRMCRSYMRVHLC